MSVTANPWLIVGAMSGFVSVAGGAFGFVVFLLVYILGMSFAEHGAMHAAVDAIWQMVEQGIGGLMVSFGIIYDLHRQFMESEKAR